MGKINVEAEKNELILENEFGDKVIIPAKKRQWVQKQIEKGNHADLDNYISTLPIKSDFAEEGSVVPGDPTKKVKVYTGKPEYFVQGVAPRNGERKNEDGSVSTHLMSYTSADGVHYAYPTLFQDGDKWIQLDDKDDWAAFKEAQKRKELFKFDNEEDAKKFAEGSWKTENIKEYDIDSPEYRELYNSGAIANYDKNSDTYILSKPLDEVTITAEAPQWAKDKRNLEKQYTKDWYIDNKMPKFSRSMGISANNMHPNNVKQYEEFINNKLAESILKRHPKVGTSANDRLEWYNSLSEKEREIVNNSYSADKFSPAVRAYMESQSNEAKKYGILETFRDADKLAQSVEGTPERFRIFPNAENNFENYVNPLMWIGDMAKGLGNIPKDIKKGNYLKAAGSIASPLLGGALGGLGAKTTGQFVKNIFLPLGGLEENIVKGGKNLIDATKAGSKVLNKLDDIAENLKHLEYAKNYYSKYGYNIPENLAEIAKDSKLTDETIQGLVNQHNTFVRGVSTNWEVIAKKNPEILRHLEGKGIDYINNPQAAAEYMSTHVPIQTGYGRAGFSRNTENIDAIYTSNSIPTAEGYTYGDGFIVKVKRPTDFSSKNRIDWIKNNSFDYDNVSKSVDQQSFNDLISLKNYYQNNINKIDDILPSNYPLSKQDILSLPQSLRDEQVEKIIKEIVPKEKQTLFGFEEMKKPIRKMESKIDMTTNDYYDLIDDIEDDVLYGKIADRFKQEETRLNKKLHSLVDNSNEYEYGSFNWYKSRLKYQEEVQKIMSENKDEYIKILQDEFGITPNRYAHYLHIGKEGDKLLEPIEAIRITPDIWKNKSRAHTNVFSKGMSAGSLIPFYLYLQSQNQNKTEQ